MGLGEEADDILVQTCGRTSPANTRSACGPRRCEVAERALEPLDLGRQRFRARREGLDPMCRSLRRIPLVEPLEVPGAGATTAEDGLGPGRELPELAGAEPVQETLKSSRLDEHRIRVGGPRRPRPQGFVAGDTPLLRFIKAP